MTRTPNPNPSRSDRCRCGIDPDHAAPYTDGCPIHAPRMSGGLAAIVKATAEGWEAGNPDHAVWPLPEAGGDAGSLRGIVGVFR